MIFSITLQPCPLLLKCPTHQTARIAHNIYHFLPEVYFTADLFFLNMLRCSHRLFLAIWMRMRMRMRMATPLLVIMWVWFSHPVYLFPVTGPIYSVGLVNLPGRLWETDLQVPASQPTHCTGPAGEVCCYLFIYWYVFIWNIVFFSHSRPLVHLPPDSSHDDLSLSLLQLNILWTFYWKEINKYMLRKKKK